ncbi:MAG: heptaprenylglyceryl phosphate synthase [Bacilli bacterium]|nr:heptaprenylglyceryl phosphate synthase [Bacilli bacterium]
MSLHIKDWKHVFKLDPAREVDDDALERICLSGTDAIIIGGSSNVTYDNTVDLLARVRKFVLPCVLEISTMEAIVPGFDLYFVPVVLNAGNTDWIAGQHQRALRDYGALLHWEQIVPEGYVILNQQSTVAELTEAKCDLTEEDVIAYARLADKLFQLPIFYMEYSGAFGNMSWVQQAARTLQGARLFYGGGIDNADKARQASQAAHTIVVGNAIYDDLGQALSTVAAVKYN